ncbi:MAG: aspartate aminotransferase family protein [Gemmobacter sp.]
MRQSDERAGDTGGKAAGSAAEGAAQGAAAGGHVFHRMPRHRLPVAVGGTGPYIVDAEGRRYLDASGGAAVSALGHNHPRVVAAIKAQLDRLAFAHTGFFTSEPAEALADFLAQAAPGGLDKVYFLSSGSEAVEAALKLARQYHVDRGEPQRARVIARRQSYHGNTLGALAVGGNIARRQKFAPLLIDVSHVSPCYAYRDRAITETDEDYGRRLAAEFEAEVLRLGPETVMCFVAETVGGATMGAVPAVAGYFARIREICDRYGILLILDEVMCGMGRTGTLFACEAEGIVPDILCIAKGLGAGYQPISAMMTTRTIHDTVVGRSGYFQHGHTYVGHPTACAAALETQRTIRDEGLLANVARRGASLAHALQDRFGNHPHVGNIRGRGLFLALEFVADRSSKAPFDPGRAIASRLKWRAMDNGLICYPAGGIIDGLRGDHVLLAPPFIIEDSHIEELIDKLDTSIAQVLEEA